MDVRPGGTTSLGMHVVGSIQSARIWRLRALVVRRTANTERALVFLLGRYIALKEIRPSTYLVTKLQRAQKL